MVYLELPSPDTIRLVFDDDLLNTNVDEHTRVVREILNQTKATNPNWCHMQIELTQAAMVDSRGLNLIVSLIKEAEAKNATIKAFISNPTLQKTFSFLKLDKRMNIVIK